MTQEQRERQLWFKQVKALSFHPRDWWQRDDDRADVQERQGGTIKMWVFKQTETGCFTVGFYDPSGSWNPEGDYGSREMAAARCNFLNGGKG